MPEEKNVVLLRVLRRMNDVDLDECIENDERVISEPDELTTGMAVVFVCFIYAREMISADKNIGGTSHSLVAGRDVARKRTIERVSCSGIGLTSAGCFRRRLGCKRGESS